MKKVVVARKDQGLLKKGSIVSIPTQKRQLVMVQWLNIQQAEMQQKKRKGKASNEIVTELRAMRLARESELEVMKKRIDLDKEMQQQRIDLDKEREQKKDERELVNIQLVHLNTLLQKEHLSLKEENMKHFLMSKFYGN